MDFVVEGSVRLLSVILQPRNVAVVCPPDVWISRNSLSALLSGGEQCPAAGAVTEHSCFGAFALVWLVLLPQSGLTVRFSHLVRVWARAGEQAGQSSIRLQCSRSQEGRSWSHVLPTFQYDGEIKANSLFTFSYSQQGDLASEERVLKRSPEE